MMLVTIVPVVVAGSLHPIFWLAPRSLGLALLTLATIAFLALNLEIAFRGYVFVHLIAAFGPVAASVLLSLLYALLSSLRSNSTSLSIAVSFLLGLLFSAAYLRTHALWLGWGVHFAWDATMAVLLGLPIAGYATPASPVSTTVSGPLWLSGGAYGPEGAALSVVVVIAAIFILYRMTRDYAWDYTHEPIVPMGYPVTVAPPVAHAAIEAETAAKLDTLVQIGVAPQISTQALVSGERSRSEE
jgi:membrane protease YdiL (CAAX protease family)